MNFDMQQVTATLRGGKIIQIGFAFASLRCTTHAVFRIKQMLSETELRYHGTVITNFEQKKCEKQNALPRVGH